jgi:hypothetical protein
MPSPKSQRRRLLVDEFQYRLLAFNLLYFFILLVVMAAFLFVPLMIKLDSSTLPLADREEVANLILSLHATLWPAIAVVFVLLAGHSVLVSHRIAGALYRFRAVFRDVAQGNFAVRATLRKRDYLLKEAAELNVMIAAVGNRFTAAAADCALMRERVDGLKASLQRGELESCRRELVAVDEHLGRLCASLALFTTAGGQSQGDATTGASPSMVKRPNEPNETDKMKGQGP